MAEPAIRKAQIALSFAKMRSMNIKYGVLTFLSSAPATQLEVLTLFDCEQRLEDQSSGHVSVLKRIAKIYVDLVRLRTDESTSEFAVRVHGSKQCFEKITESKGIDGELAALLSLMATSGDGSVFSRQALRSNALWRLIRRVALQHPMLHEKACACDWRLFVGSVMSYEFDDW